MTKDLFDKYIWLVDTIHRGGHPAPDIQQLEGSHTAGI